MINDAREKNSRYRLPSLAFSLSLRGLRARWTPLLSPLAALPPRVKLKRGTSQLEETRLIMYIVYTSLPRGRMKFINNERECNAPLFLWYIRITLKSSIVVVSLTFSWFCNIRLCLVRSQKKYTRAGDRQNTYIRNDCILAHEILKNIRDYDSIAPRNFRVWIHRFESVFVLQYQLAPVFSNVSKLSPEIALKVLAWFSPRDVICEVGETRYSRGSDTSFPASAGEGSLPQKE